MEPQSVAIAGQDFGRTELFPYVLYLYQCLPREVTRGYILDSVQENALKMASPSAVSLNPIPERGNIIGRRSTIPSRFGDFPSVQTNHITLERHRRLFSPRPGPTPRIYPAANGNKLSIK